MAMEMKYIGYYHKYALCVSDDKRLVETYLEAHRGLNKFEYSIVLDIPKTSILLTRELVNFHGLFLPVSDAEIIKSESQDAISSYVENARRYINVLEELSSGLRDIKVLKGLEKGNVALATIIKKEEEYQKELELNHPILYCDIVEYIGYLKSVSEMSDMNDRFKFYLKKDE